MSFQLIVEKPDLTVPFEVLNEGTGTEKNMYLRGPIMGAETVNRNRRVYDLLAMKTDVDRYIEEMVKTNRALGELNHPTSAEVNPERACHMLVEITQNGNEFLGKAKVLSTPMGQIVRSLVQDGVKMGMSTRALGSLTPIKEDINRVTEMRLIAVDCVADPSYPKAFVNGILESAQFVLNQDGKYEPVYETFKKSLNSLPRKELDEYLRKQVSTFIRSINSTK